jgi:hypothetical protein
MSPSYRCPAHTKRVITRLPPQNEGVNVWDPDGGYAFTLEWPRGVRLQPGAVRRAAGLLVFAAFLSGWVIDAGALHPCPHHAPAGAAVAWEEGSPGDHGSGVDPAAKADHESRPDYAADTHHPAHPDHPTPPAPAPHPDHSGHEGPCTCRSDCTGAAPIRAADPPAVEKLPERIVLRTGHKPTTLRSSRALLPHVLPWATPPPRF